MTFQELEDKRRGNSYEVKANFCVNRQKMRTDALV
jgi:hypothetical protein